MYSFFVFSDFCFVFLVFFYFLLVVVGVTHIINISV